MMVDRDRNLFSDYDRMLVDITYFLWSRLNHCTGISEQT